MNAALPAVTITPILTLLAVLIGLCLGSFYNVCIHRYLSGESIVFPPSHCPKCKKQLGARELIPVLSWAAQGGKCRGCGVSISVMYPLIELTSGLWAGLAAVQFGAFTPAWFALMLVGGILIVASGIDLREFILPDVLTLPGAALAFLAAVLTLDISWQDSLIGAAVGAGAFWLLQTGYRLIRGREGLGTGDIKLMLLIGALTGWQSLPLVVLVASLVALVPGLWFTIRARGSGETPLIPFGPFLSLGAMVAALYGSQVMARLATPGL